ncbi:hypothetical protein BH11PSE3_BH11PSE3_15480 [soil metagenome]
MAAKKKAAKKKSSKNKIAKRKGAKKKVATRKPAAKRELINTGTNKLFVRRNELGTSFSEVVDVSKSLAADRRHKARNVAKPGQGDKGDRRR